ncbi:hypothetical protein C9374_000664 [Naegleria lovaniensis]|uniref:F-box domain-containing protein n=1 Tax=Naegleria lovaniensis TaxID=51637 RepID=A0AA88GWW9_NAELO|nr:uncharacterized protein C9374_000664 [Naegleria lovaniensis]KAG2388500.1 hypothetical protein C9374_000664 [Naegleria lovaniensis]
MKRKEIPSTEHDDKEEIPEHSAFRKYVKIDANLLEDLHPIELKQFIEMYSKTLRRKMLKLISNIPEEIVLAILSFLSPVERILNGPLYCCKHWNACIMNDENLWKSIWELLFPTSKPYDHVISKPYLLLRAKFFSNKCEIPYLRFSFDNCNASSPKDTEIIKEEDGKTVAYDSDEDTKEHKSEKDNHRTKFTSKFYILTKNPEITYIDAGEGCGGGYSSNTLLLIDHLEGIYFPPNKTTFFKFTLMTDFKDVEYQSGGYSCFSFNSTLLATVPYSLSDPITLISRNKIIQPRVKQLVREYLQLSNDELIIPKQSWNPKKNMIPTDEIGWFNQWLRNFSFFDCSNFVDQLKVVENEQQAESDNEDEDSDDDADPLNSPHESDE